MKMFLMAAIAVATPAIAQQQTPSGSATTTGAQPRAEVNQDGSAMQQQAPTDTQNMQQPPSNMEQPQAPQPPMQAGDAGANPMGGYQPTQPPLSGQPAPGQQVIFQPAKSPSEAYPAPAPLQSYPICKKGQTDKCRQRGG